MLALVAGPRNGDSAAIGDRAEPRHEPGVREGCVTRMHEDPVGLDRRQRADDAAHRAIAHLQIHDHGVAECLVGAGIAAATEHDPAHLRRQRLRGVAHQGSAPQ